MLKVFKAIIKTEVFKTAFFFFFRINIFTKEELSRKSLLPLSLEYLELWVFIFWALHDLFVKFYIITILTLKYIFFYLITDFWKRDIPGAFIVYWTFRIPFLILMDNLIIMWYIPAYVWWKTEYLTYKFWWKVWFTIKHIIIKMDLMYRTRISKFYRSIYIDVTQKIVCVLF